MEEWKAAVNVPPLHPWCRCVLVPYSKGLEGGERAARGEDGKTERVKDQTYEEWKEEFVKDPQDSESPLEDSVDPSVNFENDAQGFRYANPEEYANLAKIHESNVSEIDRKQIFNHVKPDGSEGGYVATNNYYTINSALRSESNDALNHLDNDDIQTIDALRRAISLNELNDNRILIRRVRADYLYHMFGVHTSDGIIPFDSMAIIDGMKDEISHITDQLKSQIGKKVTERAFVSTSYLSDKNIMQSRSVWIYIRTPKGMRCYLPNNPLESECILADGTEYRLDSVEFDESLGKWLLTFTALKR